MTRARGSRRDDAADHELEVIDLQPGDASSSPRERATTGVRGRRGPLIVAIVLIVALAGFTVARSANPPHHAATPSSPTSDAGHTVIRLDSAPGAATPLFPFRVGAQILTGGRNGLRLVDTDTGRVTTPAITGLPLGSVTIVTHSGSTVVVRAAFQLFWFTMPTGGASSAAHGVAGQTAFPAVRRGYVWIASQRFATEVPSTTVPFVGPGPALGDTSAGLLVATKAGIVIEPTTDNDGSASLLLRAPATVIGVHADRVAWVSDDCGVLRCPVHVTEVKTGATSSWLQLVDRPDPLLVAATSAVFSPDGTRLAVVVPSATLTSAGTLIVANLVTRATTVVPADARFAMPARPGSEDATGMTVDWTADGAFLTVAPRPASDPGHTGNGRTGVVDPANPVLVSSARALDLGTTAAAIGVSSVGPLDLPRHGTLGPIAADPPMDFATPGLALLGADLTRIDQLDLSTGATRTWAIGSGASDASGADTVARVVGGWLVVRRAPTQGLVYLLSHDGGARVIEPGLAVFSSDAGRRAWIVDGARSQVRPFDPVTRRLGAPVTAASGRMFALDRGLFMWENTVVGRFDVIDASGRLTAGPALPDTHPLTVVAGAGATIAFTDQDGLHAYNVTTGEVLNVSPARAEVTVLSSDGTAIAWIENDATRSNVLAERLGVVSPDGTVKDVLLGTDADRVVVADDGTVLYTTGISVHRGRVDVNGSSPVYGLAPERDAELALG